MPTRTRGRTRKGKHPSPPPSSICVLTPDCPPDCPASCVRCPGVKPPGITSPRPRAASPRPRGPTTPRALTRAASGAGTWSTSWGTQGWSGAGGFEPSTGPSNVRVSWGPQMSRYRLFLFTHLVPLHTPPRGDHGSEERGPAFSPLNLPLHSHLDFTGFPRACVQGMSGHVVICLCSSSTSPASSYLWLEHLLIPLRRLISAPILLIGHNKGEPRQYTLTSAA